MLHSKRINLKIKACRLCKILGVWSWILSFFKYTFHQFIWNCWALLLQNLAWIQHNCISIVQMKLLITLVLQNPLLRCKTNIFFSFSRGTPISVLNFLAQYIFCYIEGCGFKMDEWVGIWNQGWDQFDEFIKSLYEPLGAPWILPLVWIFLQRGLCNYWHLLPRTVLWAFVFTDL